MPAQDAPKPPFLSIVIPAYNEASCLGENLDGIVRFLAAKRWSYEVLVVDDGSTDRTVEIVAERLSPAVRLLRHEVNRGKGAAVRSGVAATTGAWVLVTDADLSTPIEDVERLLAATTGSDGADVVFGSRALPDSRVEVHQPFPREHLGRLFNWLIRRLGLTSLRDTQCGFKLLRGDVGRALFQGLRTDGYAFDVELQWSAVRAGCRVREVGVVWRAANRSAVRPWEDGLRMVIDCLRIRFRPRGGSAVLALALLLPAAISCAPGAEWESAILIVVDTLRADHLGVYGYERPTSPNLDRWSARGAIFELAQSPAPWTLPTFGSLFTGELPSVHHAGTYNLVDGRKSFWSWNEELPTLAERLTEEGIYTGAIMNNVYLMPNFGMARGFQSYDTKGGERSMFRLADEVVDRALEWLDDHGDNRFFLTVHLFDPHLDYEAPPPFRGRYSGGAAGRRKLAAMEIRRVARGGEGKLDEEIVRGAYDEEIAFVDTELDRFFAALARRGIFDRTLVLFTADHGEELFDHGGWEHGHSMYQELLHVPLIAWGAGVSPRRIAAPVALLDVYPTVLDGLGVGVPDGLRGTSLVPVLTGHGSPPARPLIAQRTLYGDDLRAVVEWPWKLIERPSDGTTWLFNLERDGAELRDLAGERPEVAERLRERLRQVDLESTTPARHAVELDDESRDQLRALGYID